MRNQTKRMATCAMMTALCVVLMWLGAVLELGMYAAPLFAGLSLIIIGQKYGSKYQLTVWAASKTAAVAESFKTDHEAAGFQCSGYRYRSAGDVPSGSGGSVRMDDRPSADSCQHHLPGLRLSDPPNGSSVEAYYKTYLRST